jgi:HTH-type transcriptional regulator/antitoxin HigA
MRNNMTSIIATPPGATIKEQLVDRGMNQKEFAARMGMSEKHISKLINGEVILTYETSVKLEIVLGVPAQFWNNLEAIYREKLIKIESDKKMDTDLEIANNIPYAEMAKFGWVLDTRNPIERVQHLRRYFEVVELSLLGNRKISGKSGMVYDISKRSDLARLSWIQEARVLARAVETEAVDTKKVISFIPQIRRMTVMESEEFLPLISERLAKCGIALIIIQSLKGVRIQRTSFVDGNKIVLVMNADKNDSDIFWLNLFHEIAHIALGRVENVNCREDRINEEKNEDDWVYNSLIEPEDFERFCESGDYSEQSVLKFANNQEIAPSIIVGILQRKKIISEASLNNLKKKYEIIKEPI